jgi:hypothetical protein
MAGESRSNKSMPVAIWPGDWKLRKEGVCYLYPSDFTTKSGCCYQSPNGIITLIVHSNSNYDLRVKSDEPTAKSANQEASCSR